MTATDDELEGAAQERVGMKQVLALTGARHFTLRSWLKRNTFPQPIPGTVGKYRCWRRSEVLAWLKGEWKPATPP